MKPLRLRLGLLAGLTGLVLAACGGGQPGDTPSGPGSGSGGGGPPGSGGGGTGGGAGGDPVVTAVGTPLGLPTTARIGPAGGVLVSGDGQATLEVPAGALAAETELTMAPLSNEAPAGRIAAWRFGPDGLQFAQAAMLRLRGLTATEAATAGLATQGPDGTWHTAEALPAGDGEAAFSVPHFSDWATYERYGVSPDRASVRVQDNVALDAWVVPRRCLAAPADGDCLLTPLAGNADVVRWTVNGVTGGNASVGTLSATTGGHVVYTAPAQVPVANPVAITAHVVDPQVGPIQLVSQVRVLPASVRWSGEIHIGFQGLRVDHDGDVQERHQVLFDTTHQVEDVIVDAPGDDGAATASLVMSVPTVDYRYQTSSKQPGHESLAELASRQAAAGFYDGDVGYRPTLTLSADASGRMLVPVATLLTYLDVRGQRSLSLYDGTTGLTTVTRESIDLPLNVGPDLGSVPTGVVLRHPVTGAPMGELPGTFEGQRLVAAGDVWAGSTTLEDVPLVFEGQEIRGTLKVTWQFARTPP